jgi:hypothetical protein
MPADACVRSGCGSSSPHRGITHPMYYSKAMRTTLDIEDEMLLAVKEIARQRNTSAGGIVSQLLRQALSPKSFEPEFRNGVPLLPRRPNGPKITMELVNRLRDEDE